MDNTGDMPEMRRVIKRYSNRKLYDTRDSRYVTLLQIAEMVRRGEDVQIIDNTTKEDKTEVTLALAISEELKAKPRSVPLGTLRNLIQERGEKILTSLRDGPIGRLIPEDEGGQEEEGKPREPTEEARTESRKEKHERTGLAELVATSRHTLDQWQHAIDERIRTVLPNFSLFLDIQSELRGLAQRVRSLERRLGDASRSEPAAPAVPAVPAVPAAPAVPAVPNRNAGAGVSVSATEQTVETTEAPSEASTEPTPKEDPPTWE